MDDIVKRLRDYDRSDADIDEATDEIDRLRKEWADMSSAMMELRRENLHLKRELADARRWAMSERAAKWDAVARHDAT